MDPEREIEMPIKSTRNLSADNSVKSNKETADKVTSGNENLSFAFTDPVYSLDDIIISDNTRKDINTVISSTRNWNKVFAEWGLDEVIKQQRNLLVNLYGAPGTGKTMSAHAIAKALGKKIVCVNYADIESKYVGETGKNIIRLFNDAKAQDCIIFFDEADALLSKRVTDMSHSTDVSVNQTRSVLLTALSEYQGMVIFATNFISNYDKGFMRRIQFHIKFELPNEELRKKLWHLYIPKEMPNELDIEKISAEYDGLSGSDISTAVLRAALKAANTGMNYVPHSFFEEGVKSIVQSKKENKGITV